MKIQENWGIPISRAEAFFQSQEDVFRTKEGFSYRTCEIRLQDLPPEAFRKFPLPRILLTMEGEEEDTKTIYRRFWLRFLSAGG